MYQAKAVIDVKDSTQVRYQDDIAVCHEKVPPLVILCRVVTKSLDLNHAGSAVCATRICVVFVQ